jgi:3-oxoacyl-(acyl-carrier-protein) synthase
MTVPEENRPKTRDTDDSVEQRQDRKTPDQGGTGRTMREALEEAELEPDDFQER